MVPRLEVPTVPGQESEPVPPLAVQELAPLLIQARDEVCPTVTTLGTAVNETMVAAGVALSTVTLVDIGALAPPGPVQFSVYTYVPAVFRGPTIVTTLLVGSEPAQPSEPVPPLAVQALAPLVTQVINTDCPVSTVLGVATRETMVAGGGALVTVTVWVNVWLLPPLPSQLNV